MTQIAALRRFFTAPVFADEEKTRKARILHVVLLAFQGGALLLGAGTLVSLGTVPLNLILGIETLIVVMVLGLLGMRWLMWQGQITGTALALAILLSLMNSSALYLQGTIRAPTIMFYLLQIFMVGVLVDSRAALGIGTLNSLSLLALILAEQAGWLPPPNLTISPTNWTNSTIYFGLAIILIHVVNQGVNHALTRARTELAERRRAEEALRERQHFIQRILETEPGIVYIYDLVEARNIYSNRELTAVLGYTPAELVALGPSLNAMLFHPEDWPRVQAHHARLRHAPPDLVLEVEYRAKAQNGEWRWLTSRDTAFTHEAAGQVTQILGIAQDITARKQATAAMQLLIEVPKAASEAADLPTTMARCLETIGQLQHWQVGQAWLVNEAAQVLRCTPDVFYATIDVEVFRQISLATPLALDQGLPGRVWASRAPVWIANVTQTPNFPRAPLALAAGLKTALAFPVQHGAKVFAIFEFFTAETRPPDPALLEVLGKLGEHLALVFERRLAEEAARRNEERFALAAQASQAGLWEWDRRTNTLYVSPIWEQLLGYAPGEFQPLPYTFRNYLHPEDREQVLQVQKDYLAGRLPQFKVEFRARHKDGGYRWFLQNALAVRDATGQVTRLVGSLLDVTAQREAEAALRESEERYRSLVEFLPVAVTVHVADQIVYINPAGVQLWGAQSATEVLGRSPLAFVHPAYRATVQARIQAPPAPAEPPTLLEVQNVQQDGRVIYTVGTGRPTTYAGQPATLSVVLDITERKQVELALKRRNTELLTLNTIALGLTACHDPSTLAALVLEKLSAALPVTGGWVHGLTASETAFLLLAEQGLPPALSETLRAFSGQSLPNPGAALHQTVALALPPGLNAHTVSILPLPGNAKVVGWLGLYTPQPLDPAETELLHTIGLQVGAVLENLHLAEVTAENAILRELDQMRSTLIATVSHELRTPLGIIKLACTNLQRGEHQLDAATKQECLHDIEHEADKLEKIISNLLELSRLQSGHFKLNRYPTALEPLVRDALVAYAAQLTHHRLIYDFPPEPLIASVDAQRLEQVIRNLVSNAIKYSPAGGDIIVRGRCVEKRIGITVRDPGLGIPAEALPHIFERFYRVESEATWSIDGLGLGLAVCREIIEAHGGQITVTSHLGEGSAFTFTLPDELAK